MELQAIAALGEHPYSLKGCLIVGAIDAFVCVNNDRANVDPQDHFNDLEGGIFLMELLEV